MIMNDSWTVKDPRWVLMLRSQADCRMGVRLGIHFVHRASCPMTSYDVWHRQCRPCARRAQQMMSTTFYKEEKKKRRKGFHSLALALTLTLTVTLSPNHSATKHCWRTPALHRRLMCTNAPTNIITATASATGQTIDVSMTSSGMKRGEQSNYINTSEIETAPAAPCANLCAGWIRELQQFA